MRRVVVTGQGVVSPIGNSVGEFTEALFAGRSGAAALTRFDPGQLPTRFAAEVKGLRGEFRDVKITYALEAARQAIREAFGPEAAPLRGTRAALSIGLGLELFSLDDLLASRRPGFEPPSDPVGRLTFLNTPSDLCVHLLGREHGLTRPPLIHISACAAGTDAIGAAWREIAEGRLDAALAGGTDSMINPMGLGGFSRIGAPSTRNDTPETASRPFDESRDGFVLGEGAGFVVLEEEGRARARGARILARVSGYGNSLDAYSISDPHPEGAGALAAMRAALDSAGLSPDALSAVNAHGTGTPKNDPAETRAIRALLGARADEVPVCATKSLIGHLISAAGAVETVAMVQCLRRQQLHATANLRKVAEDCRLRHVTEGPLGTPLRHILKNSFGFGGQNACIIISSAENAS
jgi:3-oxoacyl-(acyl-carrier-protein) synthase